jgi:hypothetical protein
MATQYVGYDVRVARGVWGYPGRSERAIVAVMPGPRDPEDEHRAPKPVLHAVLICDYTVRDGETGKVSVIGIFDRINTPDFPTLHPGLFVYVNMADAMGDYKIGLELLRTDSLKRLGSGEQVLTYTNPLAGAELIFDLRNLIFEEPGKYEFRVYANGEHIGGKPFTVVHVKAGGSEDEPDRDRS